jgi:hypothetical protein
MDNTLSPAYYWGIPKSLFKSVGDLSRTGALKLLHQLFKLHGERASVTCLPAYLLNVKIFDIHPYMANNRWVRSTFTGIFGYICRLISRGGKVCRV